MENLIERFQNNRKEVMSFLMKQESAPTTELFGPTKSTKSTIITELLEAESNKLLGYNVGDDAQTTLIRLVLMLNSRMAKEEALVRCIPYTNENDMYVVFLVETKKALIDSLYDNREELENYDLDTSLTKKILNPKNRSYHCYETACANGMIDQFYKVINGITTRIINEPELLSNEADNIFKQRRKDQKEIKKREIYEEIVERRFYENPQNNEELELWFNQFKESLLKSLEGIWNHVIEKDGKIVGYIVCDNISDESNGIISSLIKTIYDKGSAYSLVFSEINYVTAPSSKFVDKYRSFVQTEGKSNNLGRKLKINIIDTMGITQVSTDREQISNEMDKIFQRETDAYLFLCATNEIPTTYDECISLLKSKQKKFEKKVFVICRTKADEIIRNKLINNWRKDTGKNEIDEEQYSIYLKNAVNEFQKEMIESNENVRSDEYSMCNKLPIEYLCTAPDMSEKMRKVLTEGELESNKIFTIFYKIMKQIDMKYSDKGSRQWLYSKDFEHKPLNIVCKAHKLSDTICTALVTNNMQQRSQYLQYDRKDITYHWNSVYCFWNKLSWGEGHETRAAVYGSFKLYQKNMVESWLRKMIPQNELISDIEISYEYLEADDTQLNYLKSKFLEQFHNLIVWDWNGILNRVAKKLTYDCLQPELNQIFTHYYYDSAFKISLRYFDQKFSTDEYWKDKLLQLLLNEFDFILQKMYVFDEV